MLWMEKNEWFFGWSFGGFSPAMVNYTMYVKRIKKRRQKLLNFNEFTGIWTQKNLAWAVLSRIPPKQCASRWIRGIIYFHSKALWQISFSLFCRVCPTKFTNGFFYSILARNLMLFILILMISQLFDGGFWCKIALLKRQ
jgi:hypothetical protein